MTSSDFLVQQENGKYVERQLNSITPILTDFPIHIDTISINLSILYIKLSHNKNFVLCSISSGCSLFATFQAVPIILISRTKRVI